METLKQKVAKGAVWSLLEKLSCQIVSFLVSMVLARLLTPTDYGTVALTSIFFAIAGVLVDGGLNGALIQKKDADDLDFNTVFYLSLALSVAAYIALFWAAPWIAQFYNTPVLKSIVRVSALSLFFNAVNSIQGAELTKKMLFHLSFRVSLVTTFTTAVCGITLAYNGFGVWALVWTTLVAGLVGTITNWYVIAWRPKLMFSWSRLVPLFSYGWKMAASNLLDHLFSNLNGLLIGKFYTKADLAFVNKGQAVPCLAMNQVDATIGRVAFPALVQLQNDHDALREGMRKMMRCSTFLIFPLMVGVALCSESLVILLFGHQWVPAVPYMQLACFTYALWPFHTINLKGIMSLGRSDIFLKLEIIKKVAKLLFILAFFRFGVFPFMAACAFALGPLGVIINAWPNKKFLNYTLRMQLLDVLPTAAVCCLVAIVVFGIDRLFDNFVLPCFAVASPLYFVLLLSCQFIGGVASFVLASFYYKLEPMKEYIRLARPYIITKCASAQRLFDYLEV